MILHYAPADSFIRWMAAHPGYVIVATMWTYPHRLSVLMRKDA